MDLGDPLSEDMGHVSRRGRLASRWTASQPSQLGGTARVFTQGRVPP